MLFSALASGVLNAFRRLLPMHLLSSLLLRLIDLVVFCLLSSF